MDELEKNVDNECKKINEEIINQVNELIPKLEKAWNDYVELYCEFENRRRVLDGYVRRGVIEKSDVPKSEKKKLLEALTEYRSRRKEDE